VSITQSENLYPYRSYLETLLNYGSDDATSYLTNAFWYLDNGNMLACKHDDASTTTTTSMRYIARWNRTKHSKEVEMYDRTHSDLLNVPKLLLAGEQLQIKFTKSKRGILCYLQKKTNMHNLKLSMLHYTSDKSNPPLQPYWHKQTL